MSPKLLQKTNSQNAMVNSYNPFVYFKVEAIVIINDIKKRSLQTLQNMAHI